MAKITPPQYLYPPDHDTVVLQSALLDAAGHPLGRLDVPVSLNYLMEDILTAGRLHSYMACLVHDNGIFIAHPNPEMDHMCRVSKDSPSGAVFVPSMSYPIESESGFSSATPGSPRSP